MSPALDGAAKAMAAEVCSKEKRWEINGRTSSRREKTRARDLGLNEQEIRKSSCADEVFFIHADGGGIQ